MNISTLLEINTELFRVYDFKNKTRCGSNADGGYVFADIGEVYDCYISAGIFNEESFSRDFINKYNMNEYNSFGFDGTINNYPYNYTNKISFIKKNINYYNDDNNDNLIFLLSKYNNIFLKMDIEGAEYPWLLSMDHEKLNKISQLVIEFHGLTNTSWHNNMKINNYCSYIEKIECLQKLNETFYLVHAHGNNSDLVDENGMPNVIELTYVNKRFFNKIPEFNTIPLPIEGLDFSNESQMPDINLNFYPFVNIDIQKLKNENPFLIDIQDKEEYSMEDYINIQKQLNSKDITTILKTLYDPIRNGFYDFDDFKMRVSRGITQKLIDTDENLLPTKKLYKIGNGGNNRNCFVCCAPLSHTISNTDDNSRYSSSQKILKSLEDVGFNGHFYLFNGGFPNPTGTEMKYVGVPYCFKIFMMLEAEKLGFDKVIWIDSGCYALNNPEDLFESLNNDDVVFKTVNCNNNYKAMVLKTTNEILNQFTSALLVSSSSYIETIVFGLNLSSIDIKKIIKEYYELVKIGWAFFSIFPEEIVLSALFNKPEYKYLLNSSNKNNKIQIHEKYVDEDVARNYGYYFHHKDYSKYKK